MIYQERNLAYEIFQSLNLRKRLQISNPISETFYVSQFPHLLYHFSYVYKPAKSVHLASYSLKIQIRKSKYFGYYGLA